MYMLFRKVICVCFGFASEMVNNRTNRAQTTHVEVLKPHAGMEKVYSHLFSGELSLLQGRANVFVYLK